MAPWRRQRVSGQTQGAAAPERRPQITPTNNHPPTPRTAGTGTQIGAIENEEMPRNAGHKQIFWTSFVKHDDDHQHTEYISALKWTTAYMDRRDFSTHFERHGKKV